MEALGRNNQALSGSGPPKELEGLLSELERTGPQFHNVPRPDGQFLNLLLKVARAQNVLEVGTANGYSGIWISLALEETNGKLTTIEISPKLVRQAKENLNRAKLAHRVNFLEGDAHKVIRGLEGPFDFVFLDADKGGEIDYFNNLFPNKLSPGSVVVVHNAIRYRAPMQSYLDLVRKHPQFDTVILTLTMEDGFAVSYRRRK